ncbi:MAG: dihydropteroate synthase [Alphaproteobacteria bacterium]|nr:dihydropteroate synthase [Alphaproteobacteria bacterium]
MSLNRQSPLKKVNHTVWQDRMSNNKLVIMGIVNVTPDSFSDGGQYLNVERAVAHALRLDAEGADILDIGGESTRPGATPISHQEELDRVIPVIEALTQKTNKTISIDTRHTSVMTEAVKAGASFINDVNALCDNGALALAAKYNVPVCLMHMQKQPENMQDEPSYSDIVTEVFAFLEQRISACVEAGIDKKKIVVDVGIGFGKTLDHNLALLKNIERFHALNVPILLGTSRKRFIGEISGQENASERLGGSISSALYGRQHGVKMFRVHDVAQTQQAFDVFLAIDGHHVAGD